MEISSEATLSQLGVEMNLWRQKFAVDKVISFEISGT
jgi:hypothetical protein